VLHPATLSAAIWTRGAVRPMPPTVLGVPSDLTALARSGIVSSRGLARAGLESVLPRLRPGADLDAVSVAAVVSKRLGGEIVDRLVEPLLGGVYAGHANRLSLRAAAPQIAALIAAGPSLQAAARATRRRVDIEQKPVFAGIRGGVGRLASAIAATPGIEIRLGSPVRELHRDVDRWRLVLGSVPDPQIVEADAVVLATPTAPSARMLSELAPHVADELRRIEYASMAVVTLAYPRLEQLPTGSGFLVPSVEGRTIKASTYSHAKWAWSAEAGGELAVLRASVGRLGEEYVLQRSDEELVALAMSDLKRAIGLDAPVVGSLVTRWGGGLPQYAVGHLDRVDRVEAAVAAVPGLAVCGAAYRGVGIAACVASGGEAATRVQAHLAALETMAP